MSWEVRLFPHEPENTYIHANKCIIIVRPPCLNRLIADTYWCVSSKAPPCNGAPVTEYRLEWGAAEGSMQLCYSGPGVNHEMKGLLPATNYFCRVQVSGYRLFQYDSFCEEEILIMLAIVAQ